MEQQEEHMMATGRAVQALVTQVSVSSILFREPQLCCSFLAKCSLYISLQPCSFPSEESKVAFVVTLLTGRAASWGTTVWEQRLPCCTSFQSFSDELNKVFDRAASGREVAWLLAELSQGDCTVTEYSTEFHTLAAECGWNDEAQWDMFLYGLSDLVKDEIYSLELPAGQQTLRGLPFTSLGHFASTPGEMGLFLPDPIQMGRSRLLQQQKQRCRERGLCLYCGAAGHIAGHCLVKASAR